MNLSFFFPTNHNRQFQKNMGKNCGKTHKKISCRATIDLIRYNMHVLYVLLFCLSQPYVAT